MARKSKHGWQGVSVNSRQEIRVLMGRNVNLDTSHGHDESVTIGYNVLRDKEW